MFAAQPLLLAAGGLALGAAIAASLPRTDVEARTLGDAADELKRQAGALVSQGAEQAKSTLKDVAASAQNEMKRHGLTPEALGDRADDIVGKTGDAAREAGKEAGLI